MSNPISVINLTADFSSLTTRETSLENFRNLVWAKSSQWRQALLLSHSKTRSIVLITLALQSNKFRRIPTLSLSRTLRTSASQVSKIKENLSKIRKELMRHNKLRLKDKSLRFSKQRTKLISRQTLLARSKQKRSNNGKLKLRELIMQVNQNSLRIINGREEAWEILPLKSKLSGRSYKSSLNNATTNWPWHLGKLKS